MKTLPETPLVSTRGEVLARRHFELQQNRILTRGYVAHSGLPLENWENQLLFLEEDLRGDLVSESESILTPVLLVAQESLVPFFRLMGSILYKGQKGKVSEALKREFAEASSPGIIGEELYILRDIRIDTFEPSSSIGTIKSRLQEEGRRGLRLDEAIALAVHYPEVFEKGGLRCLASSLGNGRIPALIRFGKEITLIPVNDFSSLGQDQIPSCLWHF